MIDGTIENISKQGGNSELSPEMQEEIKSVQKLFKKSHPGLKLIVAEKLWGQTDSKKEYSCTVEAEAGEDDCLGCNANFTIPVDNFSIKSVLQRFQELQKETWDTSSASEEEAVEIIKQRYANEGKEMPEELKEFLREAV